MGRASLDRVFAAADALSVRLRTLILVALLAAAFFLLALANEPMVGLSFLFLVPTLLGALFFGRGGGLGVGLVGATLFAVNDGLLNDQPLWLTGTLVRAAVFCAVGYVFARVIEQRHELSAAVASRERELQELRAMQEALVPAEVPRRPALDLATCYVPAQEGVAGDFYIVAEGPGDATVVVIGDVVGKGIEAARRASFVRTALATFAPFTDEPARLLEMANYSLIEKAGTSSIFVTAACVSLRPKEGLMSWALAGHPPPMWLDAGAVLNGGHAGIPLGIEIELGCRPSHSDLRPGSGVLLFTDGLSEARRAGAGENGDPSNDLFGIARIEQMLAELRGAPPAAVVRELRGAAETFSGGALADDLCLVAARA